MDLEIKWLKDFLALAKIKNFSKAAEQRHISQPAFSRRIKSLENHLNCSLFDRLNQPVLLTEQGMIFKQTAQNILLELSECAKKINPLLNEKMLLRFAATHTLSMSVFPSVLQQINQQPFNIETELKVADADDCIEFLSKGQCDYLLAFSDPKINVALMDSVLLGTIQLLPVCKADPYGKPIYKLTNTNEPTPYLAYQNNIFLGRVVNELINDNLHSFNLRKTLESSMADSLKMMALKGLGVAWVPDFSIQEELETQQLALCDSHKWQPTLEVRIYRNKRMVESLDPIWDSFSAINI